MLRTKKAILGTIFCVVMTICVALGVTSLSKTKTVNAETSSITTTVYGNFSSPIYSSNGNLNDVFSEMHAKYYTDYWYTNTPLYCVIDISASTYSIDNLDSCHNLSMPITINLHGNTLNLNYGDYWEFSNGLTINGDGGTITTSRSADDYNCSMWVDGGNLTVNGTNFKNINTNMDYPIFATANGSNFAYFADCTFNNCHSKGYGGAICMERTKCLTLTRCTFDNCSAQYGGAVYLEDIINESAYEDYLVANNCTFKNCKASDYGGVLYVYNNKTGTTQDSFVNNSKIEYCSANYGGAIYLDCYDGSVDLDNTVIDNCKATYDGGAIYCNATKSNVYHGEISNCSARYGGGIFFNGKYSAIWWATIHDCKATKSGGGKYTEYTAEGKRAGTPDCTFYNNSPSDVNATLMSDGSLAILFGILAGVFLVTTCVFVVLYYKRVKSGK